MRQRPAEGNEVDRPPWRSGMEESAFQRRSSTSRSPTLHLCLHDALNVLLKFEPELLMISLFSEHIMWCCRLSYL